MKSKLKMMEKQEELISFKKKILKTLNKTDSQQVLSNRSTDPYEMIIFAVK